MQGNNKMTFCHAQVVKMVQYYFDNVLFAEGQAPVIEGLAVENYAIGFTLKPEEKVEDGPLSESRL